MTNLAAIEHNTLATIEDLENSFALAVRQRELLETYIKDRLKPGNHFYTIGGQKPSLTKDGAELICLPHNYKPQYFMEGGPDQPPEDNTPYQITMRCRLMRGDTFAGEGFGSASSHVTKRDGARTTRQPDIGLRHNATLKMAQKSAYIAATLNATAASEFFTQDMEDAPASTTSAPQQQAPVNALGTCPTHRVDYFQSANMRSPAHKTDDGGWCNKPTAAPRNAPQAPEPHQAGEVFPPDEQDRADFERHQETRQTEPDPLVIPLKITKGEFSDVMKGLKKDRADVADALGLTFDQKLNEQPNESPVALFDAAMQEWLDADGARTYRMALRDCLDKWGDIPYQVEHLRSM
jgi:hypothetical protein